MYYKKQMNTRAALTSMRNSLSELSPEIKRVGTADLSSPLLFTAAAMAEGVSKAQVRNIYTHIF